MEGEQLKQWRRDKGLSRKQVGEKTGHSEHAVAKWEQGLYPIPKSVEHLLLSQVTAAIPVEHLGEIIELAASRKEPVETTIMALISAGLKSMQEKTD